MEKENFASEREPSFGVEKLNGGQNICSRDASVGNGKNFEKQAQSSKLLRYIFLFSYSMIFHTALQKM